VGQKPAVEAVVEAVALFKAGLQDPAHPIATFLFIGPTGVGKTELARLLATFIFGSVHRLLRFDLSEFKSYHSFEMLLGDPNAPGKPARLVDPVRRQPFQVILFDELEKAHPNVWDLLLPLLDDGRLTPPGGQAVDFRNTIIIATSNIGAQEAQKALGFGAETDSRAQEDRLRKALESAFKPEFLNRFQHIVVFHPLTKEQVRRIAQQELKKILDREGITGRNLIVDVDEEAIDFVIKRGFDARYGARALKREVQRQLVLPLAIMLMEKPVEPGSILTVSIQDGAVRTKVVETTETIEIEGGPVRLETGAKVGRKEVLAGIEETRNRIETISRVVDEVRLKKEQNRLGQLQSEPDFWKNPPEAIQVFRDLDRLTVILERLERLRMRVESLAEELPRAATKHMLEQIGYQFLRLQEDVRTAHLELACMDREAEWDALVEIRPLTRDGRAMRDLLAETYRKWADHRRVATEWLCEPRTDEEPVFQAFKGHYVSGYLMLEGGIHRLRQSGSASAARVRVSTWKDGTGSPDFGEHFALKTRGQFGGRIRSRLECSGGIVLQNERTLAENRELAADIVSSWTEDPTPLDEVVRRYDRSPSKIRDGLTGFTSGRSDALEPASFHELLCRRIEVSHAGKTQ
jgi:hypothetical protein